MVFFCKCLIKPWCRVVGVRRTLLAGYATQAALYILAWVGPDGTVDENAVKLAQTGDIF